MAPIVAGACRSEAPGLRAGPAAGRQRCQKCESRGSSDLRLRAGTYRLLAVGRLGRDCADAASRARRPRRDGAAWASRWRIASRARSSAAGSRKNTYAKLAPNIKESSSYVSCATSSAASISPRACASRTTSAKVSRIRRVHVAQVVPDRPCFRVKFGSRGHEKTPPGKDRALEIRQKGLTDGEDTARTRGCGPSRLPHFTLEHVGRGINRRDLEVFLRSKVREEAALAHADVVSQARYRQTIESLDRRQFSGGVQDRLTAPGAVRPSAPSIRFGISRPSP